MPRGGVRAGAGRKVDVLADAVAQAMGLLARHAFILQAVYERSQAGALGFEHAEYLMVEGKAIARDGMKAARRLQKAAGVVLARRLPAGAQPVDT